MKFAAKVLKFGVATSMLALVACNQVEIPAEHRTITPQAQAVAPIQAAGQPKLMRAGIGEPRTNFQASPQRVQRSVKDLIAQQNGVQGALAARNQAPVSAKHGEEIFESSCAKCHGFKGNAAPSLLEAANRMDYALFNTTVTNGRAGMPAHPQLTEVQKQSVWAFIESAPAGSALAKTNEGSGCGCGGSCGGGGQKAAAEGGGCGGGCGQKAAAEGGGCGGGCGQKAAAEGGGCGGGCGQKAAQGHGAHAGHNH